MQGLRLSKLYNNKLALAIALALICALVLSATFAIGLFYNTQLKISDALFSEKQGLNEIVIVKIDDKSLQELGRWPWKRSLFAEFLEKLPQDSVVGLDVSFFESSEQAEDERLAQALQGRQVVLTREFYKFEIVEGKIVGTGSLEPIAGLNSESGFVNLYSDSDGVSRTFPTRIQTSSGSEESFAQKIAEKFLGAGLVLEEERMIINFTASENSFTSYSFSEVLDGEVAAEEFAGKIILVGATARDLHDEISSPLNAGEKMPGIIAHANIVQMLLKKNYLHYQQDWQVFLLILAFAVITALLLWRFRIWIAGIASFVLLIAFLFFAVLQFESGIIVNFVFPLLAIIASFVLIVAAYYFAEEKQKQWVKNIFGKYVSESIAKEILEKSSNGIKLGGSRKYITVLFADIRGFTSMSEKLKPEEVVEVLNTYLGDMTKAVFEFEGTLDKYIGDAIMAIFNAPLEQEGHELLAVKAGLEMQKAVRELNAKTGRNLEYGIGINSGFAVVGNIGSEKRAEYTAIGDSVNLASRLCGKAGAHQVLVSLETYNKIKDKVIAKKIGSVKVKNRKQPVEVFQVLRLKEVKE